MPISVLSIATIPLASVARSRAFRGGTGWPGGGLTHATARHQTPYGMAECSWRIVNGTIDITVVIPPNTSAIVNLPGSDAAPIEVGSGSHH